MKRILLTGFALVSIMATAQNSWVAQSTKFAANYGVDEISIVDANTVWLTAYDGSGATPRVYPKVFSRTTNGGATWSSRAISGLASNALIADLHAIDGNTAFIVTAPSSGSVNANGVWKTTDAGASWTKQAVAYNPPGATSFINHIYFWDANNGWTSGDPVGGKFEMYKTSNGGTTWTAVPGALAPENSDESTYVGQKEVQGDHIWTGTSIGRILHSADRGNTWTGVYTSVLDFGGAVTAGSSAHLAMNADKIHGLLIAVDGAGATASTVATMYSTSDGGATWEPVDATGTWYFADVAYVPGTANTYVTTGSNFNKPEWMGSSYTTDGGLTWKSIDTGEQRGKLNFLNSTTGFAGQFSDGPSGTKGIMKFQGDLALATSEAGVKSNLKIFPNPATDVVKISSNNKIENVTVIDLAGRKVQSAKGSEINVSSLAKGTYILQVSYGGGAVENTKLIKK